MQSKILVQTQKCKKNQLNFHGQNLIFLHDYLLHGKSTLRWTKDDS
jgi:hypothetical protein